MTLEEKAGQLNQGYISADGFPALEQLAREGKLGSVILAFSPLAGSDGRGSVSLEEANRLQRIAVEESRLGIPILAGRDVIHGCRTVFPLPLAQAASWDMELVERAARVAATEAYAGGVRWTFSPMLDIARDPRWGRIVEGGGEDTHLTAELGAAMVRGYQGRTPEELAQPGHLLACAKHFAGYGAAEGGRDYNTGEISRNTLRNIYLPPFKAALDAGAWTVMSGFHDLDGESVSGSRFLLTEILREEWGFRGFVISDWASVEQLANHRLVATRAECAAAGFNAGVDMDMCSNCYIENVPQLVRDGTIPESRLDAAVLAILSAKLACGLFENPYAAEPVRGGGELFCAEHRALARKLAARSMVLLKNEGDLLPLPKTGLTLALVGPFAHQRRTLFGTWSLDGREEDTATLAEAFRAVVPDAKKLFIVGTEDDVASVTETADVIIVCVGESYLRNGENGNVADISLPDGQGDLVRRLKLLGKKVVAIVNSARPLAIPEVAMHADAILYAWNGGTEHAAAVCDLVFGDVAPSAKLPVGLLHHSGQIPMHYNHKSTGKPFVGLGLYRDLPNRPLYPFGFGLGYTSFTYADIRVDRAELPLGEEALVSVRLTNTGARAGEEVVQCYVQDCVASTTRPVRELKAFRRVPLAPGESATVEFSLGPGQLGFFGADGRWTLERGDFKVWIGGDSRVSLETSFRLT